MIDPIFTKQVEDINKVFEGLRSLSNDELRDEVERIKSYIKDENDKAKALDQCLTKAYAILKETARRLSKGNLIVTANKKDEKWESLYDFLTLKDGNAIYVKKWSVGGLPYTWEMVHYDEQILGGILLHHRYAVEMVTGEGKTLVATLPVFLNALSHEGVHLMTANAYLSKRDYEMTRPLYMFYGLTVGCIEETEDLSCRKEAYKADITFGTCSSFTFDYLRDHLITRREDRRQGRHSFALIDELDSILIDESITPHLIGSAPYYNNGPQFEEQLPVILELIGIDSLYTTDRLRQHASFTEEGKQWLRDKTSNAELFKIEHIYQVEGFEELSKAEQDDIYKNIELQNVFYKLLVAITVYKKDEDYVVEDDKVIIIDQFTGRKRNSFRWEHGLHTAVEVKEHVTVKDDFSSLAVITLKHFFKLYSKVAGMSGTIMPVEQELYDTYGLSCAPLPTHRPVIRQDLPHRIFRTEQQKEKVIVELIRDCRVNHRPCLVGSPSIKKSEAISDLLNSEGIDHMMLNATTEKRESEIIALAGQDDSLTLSTSIAGRGTDIKLSPSSKANGGLYVIATESLGSNRVNRQFIGRSGRQGDPGTSQILLSMEDSIFQYLPEDERTQFSALANISEDEITSPETQEWVNKALHHLEQFEKDSRTESILKDDKVAPYRTRFYDERDEMLCSADRALEMAKKICEASLISWNDVDRHLQDIWRDTRVLLQRIRRNNSILQVAPLAYTQNKFIFPISLDIDSCIRSYPFFRDEFLRQICLSSVDVFWKEFVLYITRELDQKEISELPQKYEKMQAKITEDILSTLLCIKPLFEIKESNTQEKDYSEYNNIMKMMQKHKRKSVDPNKLCPCGSGKKICECHQKNIRR